jgi:hypothetical protein
MKLRASPFTLITCGITAVLFLTCQSLVNPESGTTKVTAMLYNPGGSPAANAKVCIFPHDYDPHSAVRVQVLQTPRQQMQTAITQ